MNRLVLAALAALAASPALAAPTASPRWGSMDLGIESYRPNIDSDFTVSPGPYEQVFGSGRGLMFRLGFSRALMTRYGSLELGIRTGYFSESAKAFQQGTTTRSGVDTSFRIIPSSLALTYRLDLIPDRWGIPLAPYGRATFERYNWWTSTQGAPTEKGATNGWSVTGGIGFLLDFLDPMLARELDHDSGVNHTYVYFEVTKSKIDDFGSSKSWDLSDESMSYGAGLMFVF